MFISNLLPIQHATILKKLCWKLESHEPKVQLLSVVKGFMVNRRASRIPKGLRRLFPDHIFMWIFYSPRHRLSFPSARPGLFSFGFSSCRSLDVSWHKWNWLWNKKKWNQNVEKGVKYDNCVDSSSLAFWY